MYYAQHASISRGSVHFRKCRQDRLTSAFTPFMPQSFPETCATVLESKPLSLLAFVERIKQKAAQCVFDSLQLHAG